MVFFTQVFKQTANFYKQTDSKYSALDETQILHSYFINLSP